MLLWLSSSHLVTAVAGVSSQLKLSAILWWAPALLLLHSPTPPLCLFPFLIFQPLPFAFLLWLPPFWAFPVGDPCISMCTSRCQLGLPQASQQPEDLASSGRCTEPFLHCQWDVLGPPGGISPPPGASRSWESLAQLLSSRSLVPAWL